MRQSWCEHLYHAWLHGGTLLDYLIVPESRSNAATQLGDLPEWGVSLGTGMTPGTELTKDGVLLFKDLRTAAPL